MYCTHSLVLTKHKGRTKMNREILAIIDKAFDEVMEEDSFANLSEEYMEPMEPLYDFTWNNLKNNLSVEVL